MIEVTNIETKLFLVEGPPCVEKSEMARLVADILADSGRKVSVFDEKDMNHPADYVFHAYMTEDQIKELTLEEQRQIYAESIKVLAGYVVPLTKISVSLFGKIVPYKIYDKLDWETERPVMLEHWRSFARTARANNLVNVFNCCFFQAPICETLMRFDFSYSEIRAYINEIYNIIAGLNPAVIYLQCTDIKSRIEEVSEKRNAVWLNTSIHYHTSQGYGKRHGLTGFDGYIACLQERQKTELKIFNELPVKKLILTDPFINWEGACDTIAAFVAGKTLLSRLT